MSVGIKISKAGVNVGTVTDKQDLVFDSDLNAFKIAKEGSGSGAGAVTIAHGLNYTPSYLAYVELSSGTVYPQDVVALPETGNRTFTTWADPTNLTIDISAGANLNYKYYIFGDTANEEATSTTILDKDDTGIRVSKLGSTVNTTDIEAFSFASDLPSLKIGTVGNASIDATGGGALGTVAHGFDFVPAFMTFSKASGDSIFSRNPFHVVDGRNLYARADNTNLILRALPGNEADTYDFKYIIFADKAK